MANDPNNIRLGPCRVRWGGRDLGLTKGGVEVTVKTDTHAIDTDQTGKSPVNEYIIGRMLSIKCPFAETDLDSMYALMKNTGATYQDNGAKATGTITFASVPTAGDTITVAGHVFTYVTSVTGWLNLPADSIPLNTTVGGTISSTLRVLQASSDANVTNFTFVAGASTIAVTANKSGLAANSATLGKTGTAITVSGPTMTGGTVSSNRLISVTHGTGISLFSTSQVLVLHPIDKNDNDFTEDFVVPYANTPGSVNFAYKLDSERVFNIEFSAYPNPANRVLFTYGDNAVS